MAESRVLRLPPEPGAGAIAELLNGVNKGHKYRRVVEEEKGWRRLGYADPSDLHSWSEIWWAVTEDAGQGDSVRITIPDPDDPHPTPWAVRGSHIYDAYGDTVPAGFIADRVNRVGFAELPVFASQSFEGTDQGGGHNSD